MKVYQLHIVDNVDECQRLRQLAASLPVMSEMTEASKSFVSKPRQPWHCCYYERPKSARRIGNMTRQEISIDISAPVGVGRDLVDLDFYTDGME